MDRSGLSRKRHGNGDRRHQSKSDKFLHCDCLCLFAYGFGTRANGFSVVLAVRHGPNPPVAATCVSAIARVVAMPKLAD
jgi:hypothetical protein